MIRREVGFRLSHDDGPLQLDPGDVLESSATGRRWLVITCRRPTRGPRVRRLWICRVVRMADDEDELLAWVTWDEQGRPLPRATGPVGACRAPSSSTHAGFNWHVEQEGRERAKACPKCAPAERTYQAARNREARVRARTSATPTAAPLRLVGNG